MRAAPLPLLLLTAACAPMDSGPGDLPLPETGLADAPPEPAGAAGISASADLLDSDGHIDRWDGTWSSPMLQVVALDAAQQAWGRSDLHGTLTLPTGGAVYLFGDITDVASLLGSGHSPGVLAGVLVDDEGLCLAVLPGLEGAGVLGDSRLEDGPLGAAELRVAGEVVATAPCALPEPLIADVRARSARLSVEATEDVGEPEEAPAPPSCSSTCGSTQGYSYAGQTAYSNGNQTGSGSSCNGTDTYGYRYQCVQYTERVHQRSDWGGNAYTGYWSYTGLSSGTQGPYYKGLLPLGNGMGMYAPQAYDVVVWQGGSYGHVGILSSIGSSTVTVVDQNRSCGDQSCTLSYGSGYTLGNGSGSGYCGSEGMTYTLAGYLHRGWDFGGTYGLASNSTNAASQHNWYLNNASYYGSTTSGSVEDISDYITIDPGSSDPQMVSPPGLGMPAYSSSATWGYRYLSFAIQTNCSNRTAQLFWKRTTDSGFSEARSTTVTLSSGSGWQTATFNVGSSTSWSGTIDQLRLDPASGCSSGSGDTISLAYAWAWR